MPHEAEKGQHICTCAYVLNLLHYHIDELWHALMLLLGSHTQIHTHIRTLRVTLWEKGKELNPGDTGTVCLCNSIIFFTSGLHAINSHGWLEALAPFSLYYFTKCQVQCHSYDLDTSVHQALVWTSEIQMGNASGLFLYCWRMVVLKLSVKPHNSGVLLFKIAQREASPADRGSCGQQQQFYHHSAVGLKSPLLSWLLPVQCHCNQKPPKYTTCPLQSSVSLSSLKKHRTSGTQTQLALLSSVFVKWSHDALDQR